MGSLYNESALVLICFLHLAFLVAAVSKDNSWADVAWGLGFVAVACYTHWRSPHPGSGLLLVLTALWGVRLSGYLFLRKLQRPGEDWRYARWRKAWGRRALLRGYLQVFLLQGFFLWLIAVPLWLRPGGSFGHWIQWIGLGIWMLGFFWEAVADRQLARFKRDVANKGRIMRSGLWRYSRHPNYFGEILVWWGIFIIVLPWGQWMIYLVSPVVVTWLLARVSGVPMLESKYRENPEYRDYVSKTPALIPFLPVAQATKNNEK